MKLCVHFSSKRTLRKHALNSVLDYSFRVSVKHLTKCSALLTTNVVCVVPVNLLIKLLTCNFDLLSVYYDYEIACINVRCVDSFVLSSKDVSYFCSKTTKCLSDTGA